MVHFLLLMLVCRSAVEPWKKKTAGYFLWNTGLLKNNGSWNSMVYEIIPTSLGSIFHPLYGCFRKWWYPQIIHFNRVFHYKPSILGYHYFWKHPYYPKPTNSGIFRIFFKNLSFRGVFQPHPSADGCLKHKVHQQPLGPWLGFWKPVGFPSKIGRQNSTQPLWIWGWTWNHVATRWQNLFSTLSRNPWRVNC